MITSSTVGSGMLHLPSSKRQTTSELETHPSHSISMVTTIWRSTASILVPIHQWSNTISSLAHHSRMKRWWLYRIMGSIITRKLYSLRNQWIVAMNWGYSASDMGLKWSPMLRDQSQIYITRLWLGLNDSRSSTTWVLSMLPQPYLW